MKKFWQHDWQKILVVFLAWQVGILLASFIWTNTNFFPFAPSFPLFEVLEESRLPHWLARLANFDGVHYLSLVTHRGYNVISGLQAFFPLYPLLIYLLDFVTRQSVVSGLLISSVSFYGFLYLSFKLIKQKMDEHTAWWFVALMLLGPASFFFSTAYTESVFLLLLAAMATAYDRQKYWWVGIFGLLLSACRIIGIVAVGAFALDFFLSRLEAASINQKSTYFALTKILLGCFGLVGYMVFLQVSFGDALAFMHVQADFGAGRDAEHLILLPQVFWRYAKILAAGFSSLHVAYYTLQELIVSLAYLGGLLAACVVDYREQKEIIPIYLLIFSLGAYLIPPTTGMLSSMPRYCLTCLAVPLLAARVFAHKKLLGVAFCILTLIALIINLGLFVQGYWVS